MSQNLKNVELINGNDEYNTQMLYFTTSSLSSDDKYIYLLSDRTGSVNIFRHDIVNNNTVQLSNNNNGVLKSYVYFDGTLNKGLSKASVCLDSDRNIIYYIQDDTIYSCDFDGNIKILNKVPDNRMTAFTHVSADGKLLCVPMTDGRCLDYDPEIEGSGLDKRPIFDIDERVQKENLNSYLCVYDTSNGELLYSKTINKSWITHVQFNPANNNQILYNNEWTSFDCGIRRIWLFDKDNDTYSQVRKEGIDKNNNSMSKNDWVCHEMWSDDGKLVIYHGAYENGNAFIGRINMTNGDTHEIPLSPDYDAYGHFTISHSQNLVCDGYFKFPNEIKKVFENSTDNGPDPHKKDGAYISTQKVNWENAEIHWNCLSRHESDWLGQDAHPHPIYSHNENYIYFSSRNDTTIKVYRVCCI